MDGYPDSAASCRYKVRRVRAMTIVIPHHQVIGFDLSLPGSCMKYIDHETDFTGIMELYFIDTD